MLVDRGALIHATIAYDWTPLHIAAAYNPEPDIISALVDEGAYVWDVTTDFGRTPLHLAAEFNAVPEVITRLVLEGANENAWDDDGLTPLHLAATYNTEPGVVTALVDGVAVVDQLTPDGFTPLHLASAYNPYSGVITALVNTGSDVNADWKNGGFDWTPLELAVYNPVRSVFDQLLLHGAQCAPRRTPNTQRRTCNAS